MKKYQHSIRFKKFSDRKSKRNEKRRSRFKGYLIRKNIERVEDQKRNPKSKRVTKNRYSNLEFSYTNVTAPTVFSFKKNPEEVIIFISKLKELFDKQKRAFVSLRYVEEVDYDAIVVLLSILIRFKSKKIKFNGDFPINRDANSRLARSGFFTSLLEEFYKDSDKYKVVENTIWTHAEKKVDAPLGGKLIEQASEVIWNDKKRCPGLQRVLLEAMLNTNNHAEIGKEGEKHWWLSMNTDKKNKKTYFSFVDYGVGVFTSLNNKPADNKFFGWFEKLINKKPFNNNAELLELILDGELHASVTGKSYRGKGLPGIKEAFDRNQISNLFIITNNVYANIAKKEYRLLENKFSGTFLCWELDEQNQNF